MNPQKNQLQILQQRQRKMKKKSKQTSKAEKKESNKIKGNKNKLLVKLPHFFHMNGTISI